jgi:hypothetical protein
MAEPIHDKIKRSLQAAEGLYHRLVLLVGEIGSGKIGALALYRRGGVARRA